MAVSGSEVYVLAMASRRNCNSARLEKAAVKSAVEETKRIEAELKKEAELRKDEALSSIEFELSCRRV